MLLSPQVQSSSLIVVNARQTMTDEIVPAMVDGDPKSQC
jgi:hypothetical protein